MTAKPNDAEQAGKARVELPPEAQRALAEAEERRRAAKPCSLPRERGGPAGAEPTRYGDWERNGRAVDF